MLFAAITLALWESKLVNICQKGEKLGEKNIIRNNTKGNQCNKENRMQ
jgi:hypothetical protein